MKKKIEVVELKQTCFCSPSQWEGRTADNRPIYIRYRWGRLTIRIGEVNEDMLGAIGGKYIFGKQLGSSFDGYMELGDVKTVTKKLIIWSI